MFIHTGIKTDIPAFYSDWLINRLREGEVYVRNPLYNYNIYKYILNPSVVDCIIFGTKNPEPMLKYLAELAYWGYDTYWFITITGYDTDIEENVPSYIEVIENFKKLSNIVGKDRVVWRYDPILFNNKYTQDFHKQTFEFICKELKEYTNKCIFSFLTYYRQLENINGLRMVMESEKLGILPVISQIAHDNNIILQTCGNKDNYSQYGIRTSGCVVKEDLEAILGDKLKGLKKGNLRDGCNCIKTIDIGEYNTCLHGCKYCYATTDHKKAIENYKKHNSLSKILIGDISDKEIILQTNQVSNRCNKK